MESTVFGSQADARPLDSLLTAFLEGNPEAREQLPTHLHKPLIKYARHFVPASQAEDAVQRMWELLLHKSPDNFDPDRGNALQYLHLLLRTAAQDVGASYTPPGQRTRPHRQSIGVPVLSLDAMDYTETPLHERITDTTDPFEAINARIDAELLLAKARQFLPAKLYRALEWMYQNEAGVEESAAHFHLSRFQFRRGINRLRARLDLPLAV